MIGCDKAADDDIVGEVELGGAGVKFFLDLVDAADERADIDDQRLQPALLQDRADLEQRIGLLGRIDRAEMADHQPSVLRGRRQGAAAISNRRSLRAPRCSAAAAPARIFVPSSRPAGSSASSRRTSGENMTMVSASSSAGMIGDAAQPVQPAPFVLDQDNLAPPQPRDRQRQQRARRSRASRPRSGSCRPRSAPIRPRARSRRVILPTASGLTSCNCRDRAFRWSPEQAGELADAALHLRSRAEKQRPISGV